MHEFALAEAVIDTALATAHREKIERLTRIVVRIGELQRIERDAFEFALREVLPASESRLRGVELVLETAPARFRCRPCGQSFGLAETGEIEEEESESVHFIPELVHAFLRCPGCGSPDFEVVEGRGIVLQTLEGE